MRALRSPALLAALLAAAMTFAGESRAGGQGRTVAGIDIDGNGVRDDVDAWLSARFPEPGQRAAALQAAKALQAVLTLPEGQQAARAASRRVTDAAQCVFMRFPVASNTNPAVVSHELEALTFNTPPRQRAYRAYNKALSGSVAPLPEGNTCE